MAHTITPQTLVDGRRNKVIKVNIKGDAGDATEFDKKVIYDSSAYVADTQSNKLERVQFCFNGFSGELFWDATADVPLISVEKDHTADQSFCTFGSIVNIGGAGRTGDILLSTNGLASSTNDGYIILYIIQRDIPHIR